MKKEIEDRIANVLRLGGIKFMREYRFHPTRRWRFDFALPEHKIAIEFEGGIFLNKARHTSSIGYAGDVEKYREATILGWRLLRYTAKDFSKKNGEFQILHDLQRIKKEV